MAYGVFVDLKKPAITLAGVAPFPAVFNLQLSLPTTTLTYKITTAAQLALLLPKVQAAFTGGQFGFKVSTPKAACAFVGYTALISTGFNITLNAPVGLFAMRAAVPMSLALTVPKVQTAFVAKPWVLGRLQVQGKLATCSFGGRSTLSASFVLTMPLHSVEFLLYRIPQAVVFSRLPRLRMHLRGDRP